MARIPMTSGFTLIPEGEQVFRIYDVTYDEEFGKLVVKMVNADGLKHEERFFLKDNNDEPNEKALNAFSYFAKVALNDFSVTDIDHTDLIDHYIRATVIHTTQPSRTDPTKTVTFANLDRDKTSADGFDKTPVPEALTIGSGKPSAKPVQAARSAPTLDLDSLLG